MTSIIDVKTIDGGECVSIITHFSMMIALTGPGTSNSRLVT